MARLLCCFYSVVALHSLLVRIGSGFTTIGVTHRARTTSIPRQSVAVNQNSVDTIVEVLDKAVQNDSTPPPDALFARLEQSNPTREPCRQPGILGEWHVWYTDCPPPSNGQLGPFQGTVSQYINENGTYENRLCVGGTNQWITSTLEGTWEEWDGTLVSGDEETGDAGSAERETATGIDWGAAHTKVTFRTVEICVLGLRLFQMQFPPNTCRIWRTTYLDDDIRLLRAGRTGKREDESVFYTKRTAMS